MKKDDVEVGASYSARVGSRALDVRIESVNAKGGWNGTAVASGKPVRIKDARQIRAGAGVAEGPVTEPMHDGGGADGAGGGGAPSAAMAKGKRRGGNKAVKAPKEKAPGKPAKEKEPKPMSCLDAAAAVLKAKGEAMRCADMIAAMKDEKLWETSAPTPAATLYSALLREITKKGASSRFEKSDRGLFALKQ